MEIPQNMTKSNVTLCQSTERMKTIPDWHFTKTIFGKTWVYIEQKPFCTNNPWMFLRESTIHIY